MTEAEWLTCGEPDEMVVFIEHSTSERNLRLFGCACCRRVWDHLQPDYSHPIVELTERFADGQTTYKELQAAVSRRNTVQDPAQAAAAVKLPSGMRMGFSIVSAVRWAAVWASRSEGGENWLPLMTQEFATQAELARCVFGNPFRTSRLTAVQIAASVSIAQAAYDERDLPSGSLDAARLAVLSDSLEEAGCDDDALLSHLRSPGAHVRGCWALDLILGKE